VPDGKPIPSFAVSPAPSLAALPATSSTSVGRSPRPHGKSSSARKLQHHTIVVSKKRHAAEETIGSTMSKRLTSELLSLHQSNAAHCMDTLPISFFPQQSEPRNTSPGKVDRRPTLMKAKDYSVTMDTLANLDALAPANLKPLSNSKRSLAIEIAKSSSDDDTYSDSDFSS
jgi:hypothetical protein